MEKPTVEQVAWVFDRLSEHITDSGGSFRYLIYDRMGFGPDAYEKLYESGGQLLSNVINEWLEQEGK